MVDRDEIDFDTLDHRAWTLDQRSAFKARVLYSAHAARSECLKSAFRLLVFALQKISTLVERAWHAHTARQRRQTEIAELRGFDHTCCSGIEASSVETAYPGHDHRARLLLAQRPAQTCPLSRVSPHSPGTCRAARVGCMARANSRA